jgi:hypothetical protein
VLQENQVQEGFARSIAIDRGAFLRSHENASLWTAAQPHVETDALLSRAQLMATTLESYSTTEVTHMARLLSKCLIDEGEVCPLLSSFPFRRCARPCPGYIATTFYNHLDCNSFNFLVFQMVAGLFLKLLRELWRSGCRLCHRRSCYG